MKWAQRFLNSSDNGGATREVLLNGSAVSESSLVVVPSSTILRTGAPSAGSMRTSKPWCAVF